MFFKVHFNTIFSPLGKDRRKGRIFLFVFKQKQKKPGYRSQEIDVFWTFLMPAKENRAGLWNWQGSRTKMEQICDDKLLPKKIPQVWLLGYRNFSCCVSRGHWQAMDPRHCIFCSFEKVVVVVEADRPLWMQNRCRIIIRKSKHSRFILTAVDYYRR